MMAHLRQGGIDPRPTYNRYQIAIGTTDYNDFWFHSRKLGNCCRARVAREARRPVWI